MSRYRSKQSRELRRRILGGLAVAWAAYTALFVAVALPLNALVIRPAADAFANRVAPWEYWYYDDYTLEECLRYLGLEVIDAVYADTYPAFLDDVVRAAEAEGRDPDEALAEAQATDADFLNSGMVLQVTSVVPGQGGIEWVPAKEVKQRALEQMAYQEAGSSDAWDVTRSSEFVAARNLEAYYAVRSLKAPLAMGLYLVGCAVIVLTAMGRSLKSFDELSGAVAGLVADRAKPIELPASLAIAQDELNAIRLAALSDERAAVAAERRKDELVAYLAHDIKTPLTSVIGYLELLDESPGLPEPTRERYIRLAFEKAARFEGLIDEFFEITRYNLQSIPLEREPVDARLFLEQVAEELYPAAEARSLAIAVEAPAGERLYVDPSKMARAVGNVLRNAVAFAEEGSEIEVVAQREGEGAGEGARWLVTVTNQGREISEAHLKSIFEKFYREDGARSSQGGGAGLGLAIAKEIVGAHGGAIEAASAEGRTTFAIALPD